jgi:glucose/arabinose dehydrogenase
MNRMTLIGQQINRIISGLIIVLALAWEPGQAQPRIGIESYATGLTDPVDIKSAGDGRLFIVEQDGYIRILDSAGALLYRPFLDIHERVVRTGTEQGLLGMAFHPDYAETGYFYVNYTGTGDSTHISRFQVSETDPDSVVPSSEFNLLTVFQPYLNHNGGDLQFGPDGYLYIGLGDGGSAGDPGNRAQDLSQLLGKILRIDINSGIPYAIPPDNPFVQEPPARDEIWAYGLRNPWRFSFDRQTGDLWIADVGQGSYEEINLQDAGSPGGENYGWRCYEGFVPYDTTGCPAAGDLRFPVHVYAHDESPCWSVTGGYMYRGQEYPGFLGMYFFADYCKDSIWALSLKNGIWQVTLSACFPGNNFSAFGENAQGELFLAGRSTGTVYRVRDTGPAGMDVNTGVGDTWATPNPFEDRIRIALHSDQWNEAVISIRDLSGRMVYQKRAPGNEFFLNTESLKPGVYLLTVFFMSSPEKRYTTRLVKLPGVSR